MRTPRFLAALVALVVAACGAATGSPTTPPASAPPVATAAPTTPLATMTPGPTVPARPTGSLAWPTTFDVELEAATYFSSPPFDVPFLITIEEPGWVSGHLNAEFFDLLRFDGVPHTGLPTRMLAFGIPEHIRGPDGNVPVSGLTPDAALDLLVERKSLMAANRGPVELFGLAGARIDLHSVVGNNPLFGSPDGDFGLAPEHDARFSILVHDGGSLIVLVLAPAANLEDAWAQALPILDTVELAPE